MVEMESNQNGESKKPDSKIASRISWDGEKMFGLRRRSLISIFKC